ncbi:hypothetical protein KEM54_006562 [Ascosphaera aggregata]|nr:hypothetical protein KEM54_006562 [Ascosphaera aggregata]
MKPSRIAPRTPTTRPRTSSTRFNATKRVRISDQILDTSDSDDGDDDDDDDHDDYNHNQEDSTSTASLSTGLTPAASRMNLLPDIRSGYDRTPIRRRKDDHLKRRCSEPNPHLQISRRNIIDDIQSPSFSSSPHLSRLRQEYMFLPFTDILDSRTIRRIRRYGFSEEMNRIDCVRREKRKALREKEDELRALRDEVDRLKRLRQLQNTRLTPPTEDRGNGAAWEKIEEMETLTLLRPNGESPARRRALHLDSNRFASPPADDYYDENRDDEHTLIDEEEEEQEEEQEQEEGLRYDSTRSGENVVKDIEMHDDYSATITPFALRAELDQLRQEKQALFQQWRKQCVPYTSDNNPNPSSTTPPPSNTVEDIIESFREIIAGRARIISSLDKTYQQLSEHGFQGENCSQIIAKISKSFTDAQEQLDKVSHIEGNPQSDLSDWKTILDALVRRVNQLTNELDTSRKSALSNDTDLRHQLQNTASRLQRSEHLRKELETAQASIAASMQTVIHRLEAFEKRLESIQAEKNRITMLNGSYRERIKLLQDLNHTLEEQSLTALSKIERMEKAGEKIATIADIAQGKVKLLESQITSETRRRESVERLLSERDAEIAALEESMADLRQEKELVVNEIRRNMNEEAEDHERELGILNIRVATLATKLDEAQTKIIELKSERDTAVNRLDEIRSVGGGIDVEALHAMTQAVARQVGLWRNQVAKLDEDDISARQSSYEPPTPAASERAIKD